MARRTGSITARSARCSRSSSAPSTGAATRTDKTWPVSAPSPTWSHVAIDVVVADADAGSFTIQQEGKVVLSETNVQTSTPARTAMFVELGFYSNAPESAQVNFDNTIVDWPGAP